MINIRNVALAAALSASLAGCYVVPLQYPPAEGAPAAASVPVQLPVLTARLYPVNDAAASMGRLAGTISRPETGHGVFSLMAGNETYTGEATRAPGTSRGKANAAGSKGGYLRCEYTMTTTLLGNGTCTFSNGARFDMHISS